LQALSKTSNTCQIAKQLDTTTAEAIFKKKSGRNV
jgi:hypothetical protein